MLCWKFSSMKQMPVVGNTLRREAVMFKFFQFCQETTEIQPWAALRALLGKVLWPCHCSNLVSLWHKMTFWPLSNKNIHSPISAVNVYSFGKRKLHASGLKIRRVLYLSTTEGDINKYQSCYLSDAQGVPYAMQNSKFLLYNSYYFTLKMWDLGVFCMETSLWHLQQAKVKLNHFLVSGPIEVVHTLTSAHAKSKLCGVCRMMLTKNLDYSRCQELIISVLGWGVCGDWFIFLLIKQYGWHFSQGLALRTSLRCRSVNSENSIYTLITFFFLADLVRKSNPVPPE